MKNIMLQHNFKHLFLETKNKLATLSIPNTFHDCNDMENTI